MKINAIIKKVVSSSLKDGLSGEVVLKFKADAVGIYSELVKMQNQSNLLISIEKAQGDLFEKPEEE